MPAPHCPNGSCRYTFGPWTWHTKKQILAILFLLMFQNKSHDKYDASEKISVNCGLEKYILQKWHTSRQRHGVLFFQPQCCLYVILKLLRILKWSNPSFIYSWSIGHILEHEFFCLGCLGSQGSKEKKVDLRFSEQLLRVVFSTFCGQKNYNWKKNFCRVRTKKLHSINVRNN